MDSKKIDILFKSLIAADIIALIVLIIAKIATPPDVTGTVIDDTFVSNLRKACICNLLFSGALYLFLFLLGAIAALFIGQVLRKGAKTLIITAILIVVGGCFRRRFIVGSYPCDLQQP